MTAGARGWNRGNMEWFSTCHEFEKSAPNAIDELVNAYRQDRELGAINELILIAAFTLDFLCIHPFSDGNGHMARLLTLHLLYQTEYEVGAMLVWKKSLKS